MRRLLPVRRQTEPQADHSVCRLLDSLSPARLLTRAGILPDAWQVAYLQERAQRALLMACRGGGKSTVVAVDAAWSLEHVDQAFVEIVSAGEDQASELMRYIRRYHAAMPYRSPETRSGQTYYELRNGSRVLIVPATDKGVRSYHGVTLLIADEAARIPDDVIAATGPSTASRQGRRVYMSTPVDRSGEFYLSWQDTGGEWVRHCVTVDDVPRILASMEYRDAIRTKPAWWLNREYNCMFTSSDDAAFASDRLDAAVDPTVTALGW